MFNGVDVLVETGAVSDFVEAGAVLDFVEAFGVFSPVVENGIPVFEQFPRAA